MMEGITDPQRKFLFTKMGEANITKEDLEKSLGIGISELSKGEASTLIDCFVNDGDLDESVKKIKESHTAQPEENKPMPVPAEQTKKKEFEVKPGSTLALAKTAGIPEEMANLFFMSLNGTAYIKVAGLQYMAGKIGYRRIEITDKFNEATGTWMAEAKIYPKIDSKTLGVISHLDPAVQKEVYEDLSKPTNGIGTASKENVQNTKMLPFLREMAQTRALGRALRSYTGYGSTTYEELPDAEIRAD